MCTEHTFGVRWSSVAEEEIMDLSTENATLKHEKEELCKLLDRKLDRLKHRIAELEKDRELWFGGYKSLADSGINLLKTCDKYKTALEEIEELCGTPDPWQDDYDSIGRIAESALKED